MSTTRGVLRFEAATVQVLLTQHADGETIGTAVVELTARGGRSESPPYFRVRAPSAKEAWASLASLIGRVLVLALVLMGASCAPPPQVACSGPKPITCECVTTCNVDDAGVVTTDPPLWRATAASGCVGVCWDRSAGAP